MRQQIASAIQLVVQQTRLSDGTRKVTSISEITGMEGDVITMQEIFAFEKLGITQDGKVIGRFRATGVRPKCCERLRTSGIHLQRRHVRRRHGGAVMLVASDRLRGGDGHHSRRLRWHARNLPDDAASSGSSSGGCVTCRRPPSAVGDAKTVGHAADRGTDAGPRPVCRRARAGGSGSRG